MTFEKKKIKLTPKITFHNNNNNLSFNHCLFRINVCSIYSIIGSIHSQDDSFH